VLLIFSRDYFSLVRSVVVRVVLMHSFASFERPRFWLSKVLGEKAQGGLCSLVGRQVTYFFWPRTHWLIE